MIDQELENVAHLELVKASDRIAQEMRDRLAALHGIPRSRQLEAAKLGIRLDRHEKVCKECSWIWIDLLENKNGGYLTRENVDFIMGKVREVVEASRRNLATDPEPPRLASAAATAATRLDGITASISRDLDIRVRRQQVFPKPNTDRETETFAPAHVDVSIPEELEQLPGKKLLLGDLQQRLDVRGLAMGDRGLVSVLFMDLDGFKDVNDTLGHAKGDKCLIRTMKLISNVVMLKGKLYRPGGDEFVAVLPNFNQEEAKSTAERIRWAIDADNPGGTLKVTVSIGVASSKSVRSAEDLIDRADQAMYCAKKTKNCISLFSEESRTVSKDISPRRGRVAGRDMSAMGRKERRVRRSVAVHLLSNQTSGGIELTSMDNISAHGACVRSEYPWQPGVPVDITDDHGQSAIRGEVVHCEKYNDSFFIGLKFQEGNPFWEIAV